MDGGASVISSGNAKGAVAEASDSGAGLRENMSQTVTKVESYH